MDLNKLARAAVRQGAPLSPRTIRLMWRRALAKGQWRDIEAILTFRGDLDDDLRQEARTMHQPAGVRAAYLTRSDTPLDEKVEAAATDTRASVLRRLAEVAREPELITAIISSGCADACAELLEQRNLDTDVKVAAFQVAQAGRANPKIAETLRSRFALDSNVRNRLVTWDGLAPVYRTTVLAERGARTDAVTDDAYVTCLAGLVDHFVAYLPEHIHDGLPSCKTCASNGALLAEATALTCNLRVLRPNLAGVASELTRLHVALSADSEWQRSWATALGDAIDRYNPKRQAEVRDIQHCTSASALRRLMHNRKFTPGPETDALLAHPKLTPELARRALADVYHLSDDTPTTMAVARHHGHRPEIVEVLLRLPAHRQSAEVLTELIDRSADPQQLVEQIRQRLPRNYHGPFSGDDFHQSAGALSAAGLLRTDCLRGLTAKQLREITGYEQNRTGAAVVEALYAECDDINDIDAAAALFARWDGTFADMGELFRAIK